MSRHDKSQGSEASHGFAEGQEKLDHTHASPLHGDVARGLDEDTR